MKEIFFSFAKNVFFSSRKTFFFNFLEFNCLGNFIAEANTVKWRYALAKALAFADCRGQSRTLHIKSTVCNTEHKKQAPHKSEMRKKSCLK